jgi:hypothetical protein
MTVEKRVNTTYGVLEQALLELGFVTFYGNNSLGFPYVRYEHKLSGASFTLPIRPKNEPMYGGHFLAAEKAIEDWGVANREVFYELLREVSPKEVQVA